MAKFDLPDPVSAAPPLPPREPEALPVSAQFPLPNPRPQPPAIPLGTYYDRSQHPVDHDIVDPTSDLGRAAKAESKVEGAWDDYRRDSLAWNARDAVMRQRERAYLAEARQKAERDRINLERRKIAEQQGLETFSQDGDIHYVTDPKTGKPRYKVGASGYRTISEGRDDQGWFEMRHDQRGPESAERVDLTEYVADPERPGHIVRRKQGEKDATKWETAGTFRDFLRDPDRNRRLAAEQARDKAHYEIKKAAEDRLKGNAARAKLALSDAEQAAATRQERLAQIDTLLASDSPLAQRAKESIIDKVTGIFGETPDDMAAAQREIGQLQQERERLLAESDADYSAIEQAKQEASAASEAATLFGQLADAEGIEGALEIARERDNLKLAAQAGAEAMQRLGLADMPADQREATREEMERIAAGPDAGAAALAREHMAIEDAAAAMSPDASDADRQALQARADAWKSQAQEFDTKAQQQQEAEKAAKRQRFLDSVPKIVAASRLGRLDSNAITAPTLRDDLPVGVQQLANFGASMIGAFAPGKKEAKEAIEKIAKERRMTIKQATDAYRQQLRTDAVRDGIFKTVEEADDWISNSDARHGGIFISPITGQPEVGTAAFESPEARASLLANIENGDYKRMGVPPEAAQGIREAFDRYDAAAREATIQMALRTPDYRSFRKKFDGKGMTEDEIFAEYEKDFGWTDKALAEITGLGAGAKQFFTSLIGGVGLKAGDLIGGISQEQAENIIETLVGNGIPPSGDVRSKGMIGQTIGQYGPQLVLGALMSYMVGATRGKGKLATAAASALSIGAQGLMFGMQIAADAYVDVFQQSAIRDPETGEVLNFDETHKLAMQAFDRNIALGFTEIVPVGKIFSKIPPKKLPLLLRAIAAGGTESAQEVFQQEMTGAINNAVAGTKQQRMGLDEVRDIFLGSALVAGGGLGIRASAQNREVSRAKAGYAQQEAQIAATAALADSYKGSGSMGEMTAPMVQRLTKQGADQIADAKARMESAEYREDRAEAAAQLNTAIDAYDALRGHIEADAKMAAAGAEVDAYAPQGVPQAQIDHVKHVARAVAKVAMDRADMMTAAEKHALDTVYNRETGNFDKVTIPRMETDTGKPVIEESTRRWLTQNFPAMAKLFPKSESEVRRDNMEQQRQEEAAKAAEQAKPAEKKPAAKQDKATARERLIDILTGDAQTDQADAETIADAFLENHDLSYDMADRQQWIANTRAPFADWLRSQGGASTSSGLVNSQAANASVAAKMRQAAKKATQRAAAENAEKSNPKQSNATDATSQPSPDPAPEPQARAGADVEAEPAPEPEAAQAQEAADEVAADATRQMVDRAVMSQKSRLDAMGVEIEVTEDALADDAPAQYEPQTNRVRVSIPGMAEFWSKRPATQAQRDVDAVIAEEAWHAIAVNAGIKDAEIASAYVEFAKANPDVAAAIGKAYSGWDQMTDRNRGHELLRMMLSFHAEGRTTEMAWADSRQLRQLRKALRALTAQNIELRPTPKWRAILQKLIDFLTGAKFDGADQMRALARRALEFDAWLATSTREEIDAAGAEAGAKKEKRQKAVQSKQATPKAPIRIKYAPSGFEDTLDKMAVDGMPVGKIKLPPKNPDGSVNYDKDANYNGVPETIRGKNGGIYRNIVFGKFGRSPDVVAQELGFDSPDRMWEQIGEDIDRRRNKAKSERAGEPQTYDEWAEMYGPDIVADRYGDDAMDPIRASVPRISVLERKFRDGSISQPELQELERLRDRAGQMGFDFGDARGDLAAMEAEKKKAADRAEIERRASKRLKAPDIEPDMFAGEEGMLFASKPVIPHGVTTEDARFFVGMRDPEIQFDFAGSQQDSVAMHNAKVEVLQILARNDALTPLVTENLPDFDYAMEALAEIGDRRDLDEIADAHEDDADRNEFKTSKNLFDWVVAENGTTTNWRETGYLLPDGRQVRLTYSPNTRDKDHREVDWPGGPGGTKALISMMNAGAVRIMGGASMGGMSIRRPLTGAQESKIRDYVNRSGEIVADMEAPAEDGFRESASKSFEGDDSQIDDFIDAVSAFYKKHKIPAPDARFASDGNINASRPLVEPGFYSALAEAVDQKLPARSTPDQAKAAVRKAPGVKPEELKWVGYDGIVERLAAENGGKVPADALAAAVREQAGAMFKVVDSRGRSNREQRANDILNPHGYRARLEYDEMTFEDRDGDGVEWDDLPEDLRDALEREYQEDGGYADTGNQYAKYQLPGGENYREVVLAMPTEATADTIKPDAQAVAKYKDQWDSAVKDFTLIEKEFGPRNWSDEKNLAKRKEIEDRMDAIHEKMIAETIERHPLRENFKSLHFTGVPNYVAHMRLNERADADGETGLFIEEIQSDRHQKGRQGGYIGDSMKIPDGWETYQTKGSSPVWGIRDKQGIAVASGYDSESALIADLPFITRTRGEGDNRVADAPYRKDWPLAMFKRALRDAVESGKAWVGWTVGETQNERYDLSKQVGRIDWTPVNTYRGRLNVTDNLGNQIVSEQEMDASLLPDHIGKEAADRLLAQPIIYNTHLPPYQTLKGDGLKVGGKGMRGFYDGMLPKEVAKYVKQWGGKVVKGEVPADGDTPIWRVEITPEMRAGVSEGQALFASKPWRPERFQRVIPRDLFNEAKMLAMVSKFAADVAAGKMPAGFSGELNPRWTVALSEDGELYISGLDVYFNGEPVTVGMSYNAGKELRFPLTLTAEDLDIWVVSVYDENGEIDPEMEQFASAPGVGTFEIPDWTNVIEELKRLGRIGLNDNSGLEPKDETRGFANSFRDGKIQNIKSADPSDSILYASKPQAFTSQRQADAAAKRAGYRVTGVYHFTDAPDFETWDFAESPIAYFASGKNAEAYASEFGKRPIRAALKADNPLDLRGMGLREITPDQFTGAMAAKGVTFSKRTADALDRAFAPSQQYAPWLFVRRLSTDGNIVADIRRAGFDSIRQMEDNPRPRGNQIASVWGVFAPEQIKSAALDTGVPASERFDAASDSMLRASKPVTAEQDAEYMAAVERGDMGAARTILFASLKADEDGNPIGDVFWRVQPQGLSLNHASDTSSSGKASRLHAFNNLANALSPDGNRSDYGDELVVIRATEYFDNQDVEGVEIDGGNAEIVSRFALGNNGKEFTWSDPFARDAEGNVIPLSQRFNPQSDSILYASKPGDPGILNRGATAAVRAVSDAAKGASDAAGITRVAKAFIGTGTGQALKGTAEKIASQLAPWWTLPREFTAMLTEQKAKQNFEKNKFLEMSRVLRGKGEAEMSGIHIPPELATQQNREAMGRVLDGKAPIASLPDALQTTVQKLRDEMDRQARRLLELGMMSPETYEVNRDRGYFPRYYLANERAETPWARMSRKLKMGLGWANPQLTSAFFVYRDAKPREAGAVDYGGRKIIIMKPPGQDTFRFGSEQQRDAYFEELVQQEVYDDMRAEGYTVTRDQMASPEMMTGEARGFYRKSMQDQRAKYQKGKPLNDEELEKLKLIYDVAYSVPKRLISMSHDIALAELFNRMAQRQEWFGTAADAANKTHRQIPDVAGFGAIRGKYLQNNIADQVQEMVDMPDMAMALYDEALRMWKAGKTIANPATHGRNVLGNIPFSILAGNNAMDPRNAKYYRAAVKLAIAGPGGLSRKMTQRLVGDAKIPKGVTREELFKIGLLGGDFDSAELRSMVESLDLPPEMPQGAEELPTNLVGRSRRARALAAKGGREAWRKIQTLYRLEDDFYKIAAYLKYRESGMSQEAAVTEIRKWFPFYDQIGNSGTLKFMRRFPFPFLSFLHETVRIMGAAAKEKPVTMAAMMMLPALLTQLSFRALGLNDEDEDEVMKDLRGKDRLFGAQPIASVVLPFADKNGMPMQWDLTATLPWGSMVAKRYEDIGADDNPLEDLAKVALQNPAASLVASIAQNKDTFSGRPIKETGMTGGEKAKAYFDFIARQLLPPITPGVGSADPLEIAFGADRKGRFLQERNKAQEAVRKLGGIDTRSAAPDPYRMAYEYAQKIGLPPQGEHFDTTPRSRSVRRLYAAMVAEDYKTMSAELAYLRDEHNLDIRTRADIEQVLRSKNPLYAIPRKSEWRPFLNQLPAISRKVVDGAVSEYEKLLRRAPTMLVRARSEMPPPKPKPRRFSAASLN